MEPAARLRASPEQFSALIEFMERHGDLSRPQPSAQGRIKGDRLWLQCAALLNSIGGGIVKSHDKWKKVWSDWKTKTKKKNLLIRQHASGTGGGPSSKLRLTALEERVVAVIGQTAVGGQIVPEHGVIEPSAPTVQPLAPVLEVPDIHLPLLTPSPPPPPPGPLAPPPGPALTPAPATSPPLPSPPSPPPTSPQLRNRHQQSTSPLSAAGTPRRRLLRARRNRGLTPFDQATSEFVAIEQRRLRFEERRETILHEREMERLRLEALRIENSRDHNGLLQQLGVIAQNLLHAISAVTQNTLPASTEIIIPDTD